MGKMLIEKCRSFLDWGAGSFIQEFVDKYCHGQTWENYAKESPENFAKDVLSFTFTHQDSGYFQYSVNQHIGNEAVRRELLAEISGKGGVSDGVKHSEPKKSSGSSSENRSTGVQPASVNRTRPKVTFSPYDDPDVIMEDEPKKNYGSQQKRRTHGQLYLPDKPHTDAELVDSIKFKLFRKPLSHDRYTRLTKEEMRFIRKNAGLSKKERAVFMEKCDSEYFPYKMIAGHLGCSESKIKQIAVRIDKLIWRMINRK